MRKETLITLSRRTGFSVSTVSRVLNGKANKYRISEKTVKLITEEANSRNYKPSLLAKGLRTQKTNTIGLLVPGIDNPYFANIASTVISETSRLGYTTVLVDTMGAPDLERAGVESLVSRMVDGIIVVPSGQEPDALESIDQPHAGGAHRPLFRTDGAPLRHDEQLRRRAQRHEISHRIRP